MGNENQKQPKEKKEKVVIRKCHHCHKPLDEGKDFCLHCGHTYTEEDPFAAEKKAKKMKRLRKLLVILGIIAAIALVIFIAVTLILKEVNKSDFLRITEFIKSEGELVTGTPPEELEYASELEEASRLEEQRKEEEKNKETESDTESESESTEEVGALSARGNEETEEETELEPSEDETEAETESEILEDEGKMVNIETLDRYEYKINKNTVICCTEENETTFYIIYKSTIDSFYIKIILEISEENMDSEYLWSALVSYDDPSPAMSQFDFVRQYYGTFDPARVDYSANFTWIDIANKANDGEDDAEGEESETESDSEQEADEETESESKNGKASAMAKVESESDTETESSTEDGEENIDGEEGDEEYVDPSLTIDEDIENAALDMVADEIRNLIKALYDFIIDTQIPASLDELGFDKLFAYYESLDPLKNGQFFK